MSQNLIGEHLYLDVLVTTGSSATFAIYDQKFNEALLKVGNEYTLSVDRFRIPMDNIPIFFYQYTRVVDPITQISTAVDDMYSVELSYNGVYSGKTHLQFVTTDPQKSIDDNLYWAVWTFEIFVTMVNDAISRAFTSLLGLTVLPTGSLPPFFTINYNTKTIEYNAQVDFYDYRLPKPIALYMNQLLWRFFDGIPIKAIGNVLTPSLPNGRDVVFIPFDTYTNTFNYGTGTNTRYCRMTSDAGSESLTAWNISKGFYFRSNNMNLRYEIMPTSNTNASLAGTQTIISGQPIVCNFDFNYTAESLKPLTAQYILNTPYKLIDIVSEQEMRNFDLQVFWYDKFNNSYPLIIKPNDSMSIRLVFQEKNKN